MANARLANGRFGHGRFWHGRFWHGRFVNGRFWHGWFAEQEQRRVVVQSAAHMRQQFETLSDQAKEFSALARKVATETAASGKSFRAN